MAIAPYCPIHHKPMKWGYGGKWWCPDCHKYDKQQEYQRLAREGLIGKKESSDDV